MYSMLLTHFITFHNFLDDPFKKINISEIGMYVTTNGYLKLSAMFCFLRDTK